MSIPAGPVSKHNPVFVRKAADVFAVPETGRERLAALGGTAEAAVPTWFTLGLIRLTKRLNEEKYRN
jgi:hypothetical protein